MDDYLAAAVPLGVPIVAVLETHVQAEPPSLFGMAALVAATGASALPATGSGVEDFFHQPLHNGNGVDLGKRLVNSDTVLITCTWFGSVLVDDGVPRSTVSPSASG